MSENPRPHIEGHTVEANGQKIHYLIAGTGPLLVLLHGWPQHSHQWRRVIPMFAQHFTVIAPDLRGAGGSSKPRFGYTKRELAQDIHELIHQNFGGMAVNLCGYDWGANVAYAYSAAWPKGVTKLALLEMVFPGFGYEEVMLPRPGWQDVWQLAAFTAPDICERFFIGRERELLAWYFSHSSDNPNAISMEDFEVYVRTLQLPSALRAGMEYFATVWEDAEHNKESARTKLAMPVLALGGERAIGADVQQAASQFAENVQGMVLKGAGHWLTDERPNELAAALFEFFSRS